jgi:hypothetical protein
LRSRYVSELICPIDDGIDPINLLDDTKKDNKFVKDPSCEGIEPLNELE